jgi:hypothetical protein
MSLLTEKQLEEIQNFHDDIGECTEPHEECFIKKLIEWNEKQPPQTAREMYQRGYAAAERDLNRKPLSEDAIWDNLPENPMECAAFIRGVLFAEKTHGIGAVE